MGDNLYGQCDVTAWTDIVSVTAGYNHTVGLKSDGTVVAVGPNYYGQCDVIGFELDAGTDTDSDGISDVIEAFGCTDVNDADTDDDGILDGAEDANQNGMVDVGETNPCSVDSDGDGIQDGTESGLTSADIGIYTDQSFFIPDSDPNTTTDPLNSDSDNDGISDGQEDLNGNGAVDEGETNSNNHYDADKDNDGLDLSDFIYDFSANTYPNADLNGDNIIDTDDIERFALGFGQIIPE
jgi:hypothetical protein